MSIAFDSSGDLLADRRFEYAQALLAEKDFAGACDLLEQTAERVPLWPSVWFTLGEARYLEGNPEAAIKAFEKSLALDPKDTLGAGLKLVHLKGNDPAKAMSSAFIASLFDQYADRFDDHLTKALQYKGPEIILEALQKTCALKKTPLQFDNAVDLGCGTGLMASLLSSYIKTLRGVDLSMNMVDIARATGFYNEVRCAEIVDYLESEKAHSLQLLTAADVLVYVGDLAPLFQQAVRILTPDGLMAFTIQTHAGKGFILGKDMRYHHSQSYVEEAAHKAGFHIESMAPCTTRLDAGHLIPGAVVVLSPQGQVHGSSQHHDLG